MIQMSMTIDENTDDDEDIEDEPTELYFVDDEWQ